MSPESSPGQVQRLHRLGIPVPAARVYIALVELGESEARQVSRAAGIRISKVYPAIEQLQARGLATIVLDSPRRYAPKPLDDYLRELRRARAEELRALDVEREKLEALFSIHSVAKPDDRGSFSMVRGRRATFQKIGRLLAGARDDALIVASRSVPLGSGSGRALLEEAAARGIHVRILARAAPAGTVEGVEVRPTVSDPAAEHVLIAIADHEIAIAVQVVPDNDSARQGHDVGVATTQHAIVSSLRELLETRWDLAAAARATGAYAQTVTPSGE